MLDVSKDSQDAGIQDEFKNLISYSSFQRDESQQYPFQVGVKMNEKEINVDVKNKGLNFTMAGVIWSLTTFFVLPADAAPPVCFYSLEF